MNFLILTTALAALYVSWELNRIPEDQRKAIVRSWHFITVCLTGLLVIGGAAAVMKTGNVVYLFAATLAFVTACTVGRGKLAKMFN